jgi:hypothetical protein
LSSSGNNVRKIFIAKLSVLYHEIIFYVPNKLCGFARITATPMRHLKKGRMKSKSSAGRSAVSEARRQEKNKRELHMKVTKLFTLLVGSSLLFSAAAFAGNGNKKSLRFATPVTVDGKEIPAGEYRVEWSGTGPDVKVNILRGKDTVASVPAHVVSVAVSNKQDGYSSTASKDGSPALTQIFFSGEKYNLEIAEAASAGTATGAATTSPN